MAGQVWIRFVQKGVAAMRNNNQAVIRRLSSRSLKQSRVRNRIAVLAIILTSFLFTVIFSFVSGMVQITQEQTMREVGGRFHAGLKHVTREQMEKITDNSEVKSFTWNILIGYADNLKARQTEIRFTPLVEELANSFITLEAGDMPKEKTDLIADTIVLEELGIEPELGAAVPVTYSFQGKEFEEEFTLCGWYEGDYISHASQLYVSESYWEEKKAGRNDEDFLAWGKEHPEDESVGLYNVNLMFDSAKNIEEHVQQIIREAGYEPETDVDYGVNWAYMESRIGDTSPMNIALLLLALLVILVTGYLIIHNIFQISILSDIRFYGLLKTLGTTGRQLKKLVRRQAWVLSFIGIPVGLVLGFAAGKLLFPLATGYLDLRRMKVSLSFNIWIFVFGAVFSLVTVWISCRKPSRIASKVSPVEAVRYTEEGTGKKKWKKSESGGRISWMAFANLGRNKTKTCAVILSMTLSVVLLSMVLTALFSFRLDSYLQARMVDDFVLGNTNFTGNRVTYDYTIDEAFIAQADAQEGILAKNEMWMKYTGTKLKLEGDARERFCSMDERGMVYTDEDYGGLSRDSIERIETGEWGISTEQYAYTPELLEKITVLEGTFDPEKFQSGNYVLVTNFFGGGNHEEMTESLYRPGDHITIGRITDESEGRAEEDEDGNTIYYDWINTEPKDYEVMAVVDLPDSLTAVGYFTNSIRIVLPLADMKEQENYDVSGMIAVSYRVEKEKQEAFEEFLENYTENINTQMGYLSANKLRQEFSGAVRSMGVLGIGMAIVVAVIGILNFLNAVLTGIQARRREFAMLQSIGMTNGQLRRLLLYEGLLYVIISGVLSILLGSMLGWWLIRSLNNVVLFFEYRYTAVPYLIMLPVFTAASVLLPWIAGHRLTKVSVVERLREAEA